MLLVDILDVASNIQNRLKITRIRRYQWFLILTSGMISGKS